MGILKQWLSNLSQEAEHLNIMALKVENELLKYLMILYELESILLRATIPLT